LTTLGVFAAALALLAPRVFLGPLRHWDEAWYAQVSREMLAAGDWLTPRWNGEPWFHKPPLAYWGTMASFRLFGESEASARLFSALCGAATAALLAGVLAARVSPGAGWFGGLMLLAIPDFARYAGRGQLDAPVALFVAVQILCFWRGLERPRWHWLGGVAFGLAILAKGAAAGLAPAIGLAYLCVSRQGNALRRPELFGGWLLGFALAAPWHLYEYRQFGDRFLEEYGSRHFSQFFANIYPGETGPPPAVDYYVRHLWRSEPWGFAMLAVLAGAACYALVGRDPLTRLGAVWTVVVPLALSAARTKWSWYLVPMYPGAALFAAAWLCRRFRATTWMRRSAPIVMALAVVTGLEPCFVGPKEGEAEIRALAESLQTHVPPEGGLHTLQLGKVRHSVYPIAALYYSRRPTYAVHSFEELRRVLVGPSRSLFLLARTPWRGDLERTVGRNGRVTEIAAAGDVGLYRIDTQPLRLAAPFIGRELR
jgi:4-amino-4-deoxy-L-arabinose transferase-like glycosyltransferase